MGSVSTLACACSVSRMRAALCKLGRVAWVFFVLLIVVFSHLAGSPLSSERGTKACWPNYCQMCISLGVGYIHCMSEQAGMRFALHLLACGATLVCEI